MDLQQEWKYYQDEALRFSGYPYKETLNFSCADAIVRWRDYFLFIIRARVPGKGCKATPGGFKNRDETFQQAAIREFYEECRPNIPPDALEKCIKATKLFDDPHRAMGIPRSTLGVYFDITDMFDDFPEIYPADDAAGYEWVHQQRLDDIAAETYDDHIFMVKHFVKVEKELQQLDNLLLGM
jgi:bifunctional NMN adenylyltransferase/nudix hydrolase